MSNVAALPSPSPDDGKRSGHCDPGDYETFLAGSVWSEERCHVSRRGQDSGVNTVVVQRHRFVDDDVGHERISACASRRQLGKYPPEGTPGSISVLADSGELIAGDLIAGSFLGAVRHRPASQPTVSPRPDPQPRQSRRCSGARPCCWVRRPWGAAGAVARTTLGKKRTPQTRSSANNVNLTAAQSEKSPWS